MTALVVASAVSTTHPVGAIRNSVAAGRDEIEMTVGNVPIVEAVGGAASRRGNCEAENQNPAAPHTNTAPMSRCMRFVDLVFIEMCECRLTLIVLPAVEYLKAHECASRTAKTGRTLNRLRVSVLTSIPSPAHAEGLRPTRRVSLQSDSFSSASRSSGCVNMVRPPSAPCGHCAFGLSQ